MRQHGLLRHALTASGVAIVAACGGGGDSGMTPIGADTTARCRSHRLDHDQRDRRRQRRRRLGRVPDRWRRDRRRRHERALRHDARHHRLSLRPARAARARQRCGGQRVDVGDNANGAQAQNLALPFGKLLRFNDDGSSPADNPFFATQSGVARAV